MDVLSIFQKDLECHSETMNNTEHSITIRGRLRKPQCMAFLIFPLWLLNVALDMSVSVDLHVHNQTCIAHAASDQCTVLS